MRDILHKELNGLLQRRGFRSRDWAVEWGASAVDFLLEEGFTPDLGARPLKRAIERFLLAPLAKTIVEHRFPEGNQFLFVSSDGHQIQVRFIDPDLVKSEGEEAVLSAEPERDLSLKWVAFSGEGTEEELLFVEQRWSALVAQTSGSLWRNEKGTVQGRINDEGFIRAPDRYRILEKLECMERIEAGVDAAGKLWNRIRGAAELRTQVESMRRLAQQLLLLELAARDVMRDTPQNALLHIVGLPSGELPKEASFDVFQHIKGMYQSWGERRRMRSMWLRRGSLADMQAILAVSGLGAGSILREEQGLHVFALPREDGTFHLTRVRVQVSPQPTQQVGSNQSVLTYATDYFSQQEAASETICRHYRWAPSPQVHDRVLGWKTEEIGRILAGDFDLVEGDN
jgi:ATP-dependent Clp protease ATP-binding subunit ClpC